MGTQRIMRGRMPTSALLGALLGAVVLLAVSGCATSVAGTPRGQSAGQTPAESGEEGDDTGDGASTGFDECGLLDPSELADALQVETMYVTSRSTLPLTDGSLRASCAYFPEDVPGVLGMEINTVVGTDAERFFSGFAQYEKTLRVDGLGDRAEAVAYMPQGGSTHFMELRAIDGDRGIHLFYTYSDDGGQMPELDGAAIRAIVGTALERLPDEVTIPDGTPQGACADLDLGPAAEAVGSELVRARSVVSDGGGMSCHFSGDHAAVEVTVLADPDWVEGQTLPSDQITHSDVGDGARMRVTEGGTLDARINLGDRLVAVTAIYNDEAGAVTELRQDDVELVRAVVDSISE